MIGLARSAAQRARGNDQQRRLGLLDQQLQLPGRLGIDNDRPATGLFRHRARALSGKEGIERHITIAREQRAQDARKRRRTPIRRLPPLSAARPRRRGLGALRQFHRLLAQFGMRQPPICGHQRGALGKPFCRAHKPDHIAVGGVSTSTSCRLDQVTSGLPNWGARTLSRLSATRP